MSARSACTPSVTLYDVITARLTTTGRWHLMIKEGAAALLSLTSPNVDWVLKFSLRETHQQLLPPLLPPPPPPPQPPPLRLLLLYVLRPQFV